MYQKQQRKLCTRAAANHYFHYRLLIIFQLTIKCQNKVNNASFTVSLSLEWYLQMAEQQKDIQLPMI